MKWEAEILGQPCSKANSRQVTRSGMVIKSKKAQAYCKSFREQMAPTPAPMFEERNLRLTVGVVYGSWRPDLDCSLICDLMEGHVYKNDRQIIEKVFKRVLPNDKDNPRAYITVEEIDMDEESV